MVLALGSTPPDAFMLATICVHCPLTQRKDTMQQGYYAARLLYCMPLIESQIYMRLEQRQLVVQESLPAVKIDMDLRFEFSIRDRFNVMGGGGDDKGSVQALTKLPSNIEVRLCEKA